jgi:pyrimidine operon attenuation protein/uracil phosphoribosyltransferase
LSLQELQLTVLYLQKIAASLEVISSIKVSLCEVQINKQHPELPIHSLKEEYANKGLVLVDDVLNSGTTLIYAVRHFIDVPLKKFKTAVIVDP